MLRGWNRGNTLFSKTKRWTLKVVANTWIVFVVTVNLIRERNINLCTLKSTIGVLKALLAVLTANLEFHYRGNVKTVAVLGSHTKTDNRVSLITFAALKYVLNKTFCNFHNIDLSNNSVKRTFARFTICPCGRFQIRVTSKSKKCTLG
ncbi:hypothetical protein PSYJA_08228 [Pseudomonas syringae pv. japonica str. M301072]|uniref:Uncharacterized protein n=1 Tax=Pseudomonas syringae pv. japonica str. M301072 TaxID=629262 RepID=F3FFG7_PSESX|nr:hypothetical protein PSYJA_08228 [Pseudomonas syringae pv. japonica str. M301072]